MQEYLDSLQLKSGEIRRIHPFNALVLVVQRLDDGQWKVVPFSSSEARTEDGDMFIPNATGRCVLQLQHARTLHPLFLRRSFLVGTLTADELASVLDALSKFGLNDAYDDYPGLNELDMVNYCWGNQVMTFTGVQVDLPPAPPEEDLSPCWYFDASSTGLLSQLSFQEIKPSKPGAYHARFCYPYFSPAPHDPESNLLWDISNLRLPHGSYDALFVNANTRLLLGSGYAQVNEFGANVAFCDWVTEEASNVKAPEDIAILVCNGPQLL